MKKIKIKDLRENPEYTETLAQWHHKQWGELNPEFSLEKRREKMLLYLKDDFIPSTYVAVDDELLGSAAIVECDMDIKPELRPWLAS